MLMHLNGAPNSAIMKKGRWLRSAFLRYIRNYDDKVGDDSIIIIVGDNSEFISLL